MNIDYLYDNLTPYLSYGDFLIMEDKEIWVSVLGYEGLYEVSNLGMVKSLPKNGKGGHNGILLKQSKNTKGYLCVDLCGGIKNIKRLVHRIVYESFFGKTDLQIDHIIEGNKQDNRLCNLQAVSNRYNTSKYQSSKKTSSKFIGVSWDKFSNKWVSKIRINKKQRNLGRFVNEIDAANAYNLYLNKVIE